MKLEVGMYVRTNRDIGKATKIYERNDGNMVFNIGIYQYYFTEIIKASHNIIDLIEPLDLLFIDIEPHDGHGGIVVPRVPETMNEVKKYVDGIKKDEIRLVGIVTRKVIQNNCYWLEKESDE